MAAFLSGLAAAIGAALSTVLAVLANWWAGLVGVAGLARMALAARGGEGDFGDRLRPLLLAPAGQRALFAALRAFWPTLVIPKPLVRAYPSTATVVVARAADVREVLSRDDDFAVVYEPRMREITGGANFFLGMQPGDDYERDVSAMRLAMRRTDVADRLLPQTRDLAARIVDGAAGGLDVPRDLTAAVVAPVIQDYFGLTDPDRAAFAERATIMFWFLFGDLGADEAVGARARAAAAESRAWIDGLIAARKSLPDKGDDVIGRCLALQAAGVPGMDDRGIRDNLIGLYIGAIPTLSKAATLALDDLLDRPRALRAARNAAVAGDDETVAGHIWEALRFNPHNPVIYRRALRDTVLAGSTLRARRIPEGALVFAANHSAMFDPLDVPRPTEFRADRPWDAYIHWGYGLHRCFGDALNRALIPAMLTPLLARPGLVRAGRRDDGGTPFPKSLPVRFEV